MQGNFDLFSFLQSWKLTPFLTTCLSATSFQIWTLIAFLYISETTQTNFFKISSIIFQHQSLMLGAGQLCVCLENHTSIARSKVQIPLKSCIFFFRLLTQLHKSRSQLRGSFFTWFHFSRSYMTYFIYVYHIAYFCQMFSECKHPFIDLKPMVIFEATVPSAQLLALDSKLYIQALLQWCLLKTGLT